MNFQNRIGECAISETLIDRLAQEVRKEIQRRKALAAVGPRELTEDAAKKLTVSHDRLEIVVLDKVA